MVLVATHTVTGDHPDADTRYVNLTIHMEDNTDADVILTPTEAHTIAQLLTSEATNIDPPPF